MKRILILGAGLISRPGVVLLLENGYQVTVATRSVHKAQAIVAGHANGTAMELLVEEGDRLDALVKANDIVVSLLPWTLHPIVARCCLKNSTHMATSSYVSEEMRRLDPEVRAKDLLFLNEIGVDPGLDHMSAMSVIDAVHARGGRIRHFYSYCGGLPAPDDNDNPFGYKFSWSPRGVVLASRNAARYLENGETVSIPGEDLFLHKRIDRIDGLGEFEVYPNRDSLPYREIYGLKDTLSLMRGTYRNIGWCDTFKKIVDLGLVDDTPVKGLTGRSYRWMLARIAGIVPTDDVAAAIAAKVGLKKSHFILQNMDWLGLFGKDTIRDADNYLDALSQLLLDKLSYRAGEKDMLLLRHTFIIENPDGSEQALTSTLVDFGIPNGDTAMARTVSLPLACGVMLMAEGKIGLRGVHIPTQAEIYLPVLNELEHLGIKMVEKTSSTP